MSMAYVAFLKIVLPTSLLFQFYFSKNHISYDQQKDQNFIIMGSCPLKSYIWEKYDNGPYSHLYFLVNSA